MTHCELNIEALFREYLAKKYRRDIDVLASDIARPERLINVLGANLSGFELEALPAEMFKALQYAYDKKYGNWEDVNDLRALYPYSWHTALAPYTSNLPKDARILAVGANDGREILQIFKDVTLCVDVLDISAKAVARARELLYQYRSAHFSVGTFEGCELRANHYDVFFSLRTINSTAVDLPTWSRKSVECARANGTLIYSVSNGYVERQGDKLIPVKGMFSYRDQVIDLDRPRQITNNLIEFLERSGAEILACIDGVSEIFVIARKLADHEVAP